MAAARTGRLKMPKISIAKSRLSESHIFHFGRCHSTRCFVQGVPNSVDFRLLERQLLSLCGSCPLLVDALSYLELLRSEPKFRARPHPLSSVTTIFKNPYPPDKPSFTLRVVFLSGAQMLGEAGLSRFQVQKQANKQTSNKTVRYLRQLPPCSRGARAWWEAWRSHPKGDVVAAFDDEGLTLCGSTVHPMNLCISFIAFAGNKDTILCSRRSL